MSSTLRIFGVVMLAAVLSVSVGGCKSDGNGMPPTGTGLSNPNTGGNTENDGGGVREDLPPFDSETIFGRSGLETIHFDYNSFELRSDAIAALARNADKIKQVANVVVQIEGHCDERGTQEYNLALGEKRALATRQHLMRLGVSGDRIITISYGEEDPVALGHAEDSWQQNRRCEFNKAM